MTASEKLERMKRCDNCQNGECFLGWDLPSGCGYCKDFVDSMETDEKESGSGMDSENVKIYLPADKLWNFYIENREQCKNKMILIAENTETEYAVYVTEENDMLTVSVCKGSTDPEYEEYIVNRDDCMATARKLFYRYLFPVTIVDEKAIASDESLNENTKDDDCFSKQDMEDEIYAREDELRLALADFLEAVLQDYRNGTDLLDSYGEDFAEDVLDHFLGYLATEHGVDVYRPMFVFDEDNDSETFIEYP